MFTFRSISFIALAAYVAVEARIFFCFSIELIRVLISASALPEVESTLSVNSSKLTSEYSSSFSLKLDYLHGYIFYLFIQLHRLFVMCCDGVSE